MPMSWLNPAVFVQRSALALNRALPSALGVKLKLRPGSMSLQVLPLLPDSEGWDVIDFMTRLGDVAGTSCAVSRLGEAPDQVKSWFGSGCGQGPAPAKIRPLGA